MQEIKRRGKIQVTVRRGVLPQACSCSYLLVRVVALGAEEGIPIALILSHHRVQLAELVVAEIDGGCLTRACTSAFYPLDSGVLLHSFEHGCTQEQTQDKNKNKIEQVFG